MIGTNDASTKSADKIVDEILDVKLYIEGLLPLFVISCPTARKDNHKAKVVFNMPTKLINSHVPLILNDNICDEHIGGGGIHLNGKGSGRLPINILNYIRKQ